MMPTELLAAAVAVQTNALAELLHFRYEFFAGHLVKVGIHDVLLSHASRECSGRLEVKNGRATSPLQFIILSVPLYLHTTKKQVITLL